MLIVYVVVYLGIELFAFVIEEIKNNSNQLQKRWCLFIYVSYIYLVNKIVSKEVILFYLIIYSQDIWVSHI